MMHRLLSTLALLSLPLCMSTFAQTTPDARVTDTTGVRIVDFAIDRVVLDPGDTAMLTVDLEPETQETGRVRLVVRANGVVAYTNVVDVSPTGRTRVGLPLMLFESGERKLAVNGRKTGAVWVTEKPADIVYTGIELPAGSTAGTGDAVPVRVNLQNVGGRAGTARPKLYIDGVASDSLFLALYPGEESDVVFSARFSSPGTYSIHSGSLAPIELDVTGAGN